MRAQSWRLAYRQWLISGGYLMAVMLGLQQESRSVWIGVAAFSALMALIAWRATMRRCHAVADMPTSTIAAAAQGYVELHGRAITGNDPPLDSPLRHLPCLWYRYLVERRQDGDWKTDQQGESRDGFFIDDGSGRCCVDPLGAEILIAERDHWQREDYRYTEWRITPGERVYVLGAFETWNGDSLDLDAHRDVGTLLAEWKADRRNLLARFDANGDGDIDLAEWAKVRTAAENEIREQHREKRAQPDKHLIAQPQDGQLYLISTLPPDKIERRFRHWMFFHATAFVAACIGLGFVLQHPVQGLF